MSVAEARRYFERVAAPTRAGSEEGTLTLGTYMPDWSLATVSAGEVLSSTDVPVRGEFRYFRYRIDEYGEPRFTPIFNHWHQTFLRISLRLYIQKLAF